MLPEWAGCGPQSFNHSKSDPFVEFLVTDSPPFQKIADQERSMDQRRGYIRVVHGETHQVMPRFGVARVKVQRLGIPFGGLRLLTARAQQVSQPRAKKTTPRGLFDQLQQVVLSLGGRLNDRAIEQLAAGNPEAIEIGVRVCPHR